MKRGAPSTQPGSQLLYKQSKEEQTMKVKGELFVATTFFKKDNTSCVPEKRSLTLDSSHRVTRSAWGRYVDGSG